MIFVTGGTGLLGRQILSDLLVESSEEICALKRKTSKIPTNLASSKINWIDGDLLDFDVINEAVRNANKIYHCAAMVSYNPRKKTEMIRTNSKSTKLLVDLSLKHNIEKFCFISSIATLGESIGDSLITENIPFDTNAENSAYSLSKYYSELEVWRGIEEGLNAIILNPSIIIGSGDWTKSSSNMFLTVWNELKIYTEGVCGFVYSKDVSKAAINLMNSDVKNENFIVSAENKTFKEIFDAIAANLGKKKPKWKPSKSLAIIFAQFENIKSFLFNTNPLITKETAETAYKRNLYSSGKLINTINFQFTPINKAIEQTAKIFVDDYRR